MTDPKHDLKLGLRRPPEAVVAELLANAARVAAPLPIPPGTTEVHWAAHVPSWDPLGNRKVGDCAEAAVGHWEQTVTWNVGRYWAPTEAQTIQFYGDITGYDPQTGAHDDGTFFADLLNRMKSQGWNGHKWDAVSVMLNWFNPRALLGAIYNFGGALLALSLPDDYAAQFFRPQPMDVSGPPNPNNGHLVNLGGKSKGLVHCNTWGSQKALTDAFMQRYGYSVFVPFSGDWLKANGKTPSGLTRQKAMQFLHQLGTVL
jgi:hypothetical protein